MKKIILMTALILFVSALWGQSNDLLDQFLEAEEADTATTLLLVAQAAGELPLDALPAAGYAWGQEQDFGKHVIKKQPEDPVSLGLFYLALLKSFDVQGGIWFKIVGNPRYAAMEAGYMGYVEPSRIYHTRSMPPYEVLTSITYILEDREGGRL